MNSTLRITIHCSTVPPLVSMASQIKYVLLNQYLPPQNQPSAKQEIKFLQQCCDQNKQLDL